MRFRDRMARFLSGRTGNDQLNMAIFFTYTFLLIVSICLFAVPVARYIVLGIALVLMGFYMFRFFSKDLYRRSNENAKFLKIWGRITSFFRLQKARWTYRKTHVFVRCPQCKTALRLPKGKGKISIKCSQCGNRFEKRV